MDDVMIIQDNNDRLVLLSAFRYALGRSTYIVSVVREQIELNWDVLDIEDKQLIKNEIAHAIVTNTCGMKMDELEWRRIIDKLM